jgi:DNA-binding SARP family transcriptional activator
MLRIHLFGAPTVYNEQGDPLLIKRRLTRGLLYYLAAQGRPLTRDHLVDRFWPNIPLDRARAALRDSLGKLREALPEADKDLLQATRDSVTLDFRRVTVDLLEIQALLEKINTSVWKLPDLQPLPAEHYRQMLRVMQLWDGRNFLPGGDVEYSEDLSDWMRETEQQITQDLVRISKRLAAHEAASGDPGQANRWLQLALQFDEFDADIHQTILENHLKNDALKEARAYFESLERIYGDKDDYPRGVRALETRIYASPAAQQPGLPPGWNLRHSLQVPFIGQVEILAELERASRIGGAVLIYGEAGAGKTRLVQEFFRRQKGFPRLLLAACQPLESGIPFSPWVSLLRSSITPAEWRTLDPTWAALLAVLLPEISQARPDKLTKPPEVSRGALLEAIRKTLLMLANKGPLILVIDDVHWADESTLAILAYLLREEFFSQGRGLLVMTARIEEQNPQLDRFLLSSYPQPVRRFEMRALASEEIAELCELVLSRPLPFLLIEQLEQDTGGNPFFLLEILARLQESFPAEELAAAESLPLPASISDLVKTRLAGLPAEARELLSIGAVLGSSFELAILEKTVSLPPETIIDALEALENTRLIRSQDGDRPSYAFRHEKIRESLLNELSPGRKRLLNQKCAAALEAYHGNETGKIASKLALHYEAAGELRNAFEYWKIAGQNAYRLVSFYDCVEAYHRAERLLPRAIGLGDEQIYELYLAWITLAFENDDAAELERLSQNLGALGRERTSDLLIGAASAASGEAHMVRNQFELAMQAARQAYPALARSGHPLEMAWLMLRQGAYLYQLGHLAEAQDWFKKVLQTTAETADPHLLTVRAAANYQMSITETLAGFPTRAIEHARQTLQDADLSGHLYGKIIAHSALGLAYYLSGEPSLGREACQQGLTLTSQMSGWRMVAFLELYCGMNELEMGLTGSAWKHAQHAIELGRKYNHGEIISAGYSILGDIHRRLQNLEKALHAYEQGLAAAGDQFVHLESLYRRGACLVRLGQPAGLTQIRQAREIAASQGLGGILALASLSELGALADLQDQPAFEARAEWFLSIAPASLGPEQTSAHLQRLRGALLMQQGHPAAALPLLTEAARWYQAHTFRWLEFDCLQMQATALAQLEQPAEDTHTRLNSLLDEIETGLEDAPILHEWQLFWEKYGIS